MKFATVVHFRMAGSPEPKRGAHLNMKFATVAHFRTPESLPPAPSIQRLVVVVAVPGPLREPQWRVLPGSKNRHFIYVVFVFVCGGGGGGSGGGGGGVWWWG